MMQGSASIDGVLRGGLEQKAQRLSVLCRIGVVKLFHMAQGLRGHLREVWCVLGTT